MTRRIALLLEHTHHPTPGEYDYRRDLMQRLLAHAGINMADCFLGYGDDPALPAKLATYQPHFIVLWEQHGSLLRLFGTQKRKLDDWAGYVWRTEACVPGVKCLATYSAGRIRVEMGLTGRVRFHLARVAREAATDELVVPDRRGWIAWPDKGEWWEKTPTTTYINKKRTLAQLANFRSEPRPLAIDIEGGCGMGPACIGFAQDAHHAIVVPFYDVDGCSLWSEEDELELWEAVAGVLEDEDVPKVIQNALYELFVLAWTTGIVVRGLQDDTMLKHFEIYCELDKALEFQATLYTNQPYWKLEHRQVEGRYVPFRNGRRATTEEWLVYNGTDCCVTYECNEVMEAKLKPQQREHYRFNMDLLVPLTYMSLRGIRYDEAKAKERLAETQTRIYELQDQINQEAARSPERAGLRQFYEALGVRLPASGEGDRSGDGATVAVGPSEDRRRDCGPVQALIPLLTSAFCCCERDRRERVEVVETTWQPHRWNGKRWVKHGKRIQNPFQAPEEGWDEHWIGDEEPHEPEARCLWLKPHRRTVSKLVPVAVETFEDVRRFALGSKEAECRRACKLLSGDGILMPAQRGELATLLGLEVKINSTGAGGDAQWYLYTHCGLPRQYQKEGNKLTTRLASDDEAIIKAWIHSGKTKETRDERALVFLRMRRMVTQTKFLVAEPDEDGRIRSSMNLVATPTCRMAMYGSPTGTSDLNLQTIGKGLRDLFVADEGCFLGQKDLSNSDAYTVAAFCAMLGDSTMLDDLRAKVKPANVLARIYEAGPAVNQLTRDQLREECKKVDSEGWLYFACKRVLHGSNYGMGKVTMANQILTDSFKLLGEPIWLDPSACARIQERAFFIRYPGVRRWHDWMAREIREKGVLTTSTGFQRRIFGRKDSHDTLKECLAHYPQYITTRAIKMTLWRQWRDPANRREDGSLRVEPLLLVHDSNVSQWREEDTGFAKWKLAEWFDNPMQVAGLTLTIPASGTYGRNWKEQDQAL